MHKNLIPFLVGVVVLCSCTAESQPPQRLLYEAAHTSAPALTRDTTFRDSLTIAFEGKQVPLLLTWGAGRDSTDCARIANVRVERTGGDPSVVIDTVTHELGECAMEYESEDTTRFERATVMLEYRTRSGIRRSSANKPVIELRGSGEMRTY